MTQSEKAQAQSPNTPDTHSQAIEEFQAAQRRVLSRYGITALLACERLPEYGPGMLSLMNAVMRFGKPRPEIALTAEQLAKLRHPVQLIWGEKDPFGSVDVARRAADLLPDAELHIIPGGHGPWFHRAEEIGALVRRFLNDHPDG